jgi:hypothetical protein
MFLGSQQVEVCIERTATAVAASDRITSDYANLLGLLIIPTLSGVVLIA